MRIPGIHGEWTMIDCKDGLCLMRSAENGVRVPMLVVDSEMNLIGETAKSLDSFLRYRRRSHGKA